MRWQTLFWKDWMKMENLPDEQFMNLELDLYRPDAPEEEKA